jgi:hypothetical protein
VTPAHFVAEVSRLAGVLLEHGIAVNINTPRQVSIGNGVVSVGVPQGSAPDGADAHTPFHRIDEYRRLVEAMAYVVVLKDGSLLQIDAAFRGNVLIKHRYCFYPCPFDLQQLELDADINLLDVVSTFSASDFVEQIRLLAPLRFEFDPNDARPGHPASHAHIGASSCRIPVHAPLSLGHFVRFVVCHFFPSEWDSCEQVRNWPVVNMDRTVTAAEEQSFYLECRRVQC